MQWTVVVPLKPPTVGKSRLRTLGSDDAEHVALVLAFARDTLDAVLSCSQVGAVILVCDADTAASAIGGDNPIAGAERIRVVHDAPGIGLNGALRLGEQSARAARPQFGIAALSADLPALTAGALSQSLGWAHGHARSFVADRPGTGTTMLCASPGAALDPMFGVGSAAAHAQSGAVRLEADPRLRADVDTEDDLDAALRLGVGPATAGVPLVRLHGAR